MQSVLYNPRATATPSERMAAEASRIRRARIAANAITEPAPRLVYVAPVKPAKPEPVPVYRMWFEDLIAEAERAMRRSRRILRIEDIQSECALFYGVSRDDILCPTRKKEVVRPRQVGMYLARKMTDKSLPDIARRFGNRDHTTGMYAVNKMARLIEIDSILAAEVDAIRAAIVVRLA